MTDRIRFAEPVRELAALGGAVEAAAAAVIASGHYVLGPPVVALEHALARELSVRRVVGLSSGSDALVCALLALGIGPGDEVVVPAYSFVATAEAVRRVGAAIRFCDVRLDDALIDEARAAEAVTERTRAVVAVDLYGRLPDFRALRAIDLPLVEDAAQAMGTEGAMQGGTIACSSFYPSKALSAAGDAGACATNDDELADRITALRQHGRTDEHRYTTVGGNFRIDALQAAIVHAKLPQWRARTARRHEIARSLLSTLELPTDPPPLPFVALRVRDRGAARAALQARGIDVAVHYPYTLNALPPYLDGGRFPNAERWAAESLCIPCHAELLDGEIERLLEACRAIRGLL